MEAIADHTLFADFSNRQDADRAVHDLEGLGYGAGDISVIAKAGDVAASTHEGHETAKGAVGGATTGGIIGGVAGLLAGVGVVPAIAGLLIGGPVAAALGLAGVAAVTVSGAVTGALAGGLIGALTRLGLSKEDAEYYNQVVDAGGVVLGVPVTDANEASVQAMLEGKQQSLRSDAYAPGQPTMTSPPAVDAVASVRRVRLVKHVVTENVNVSIPVSHEEIRVETDEA